MSAPWWEGSLVGFDTETTGPDPEVARIVTACVVLHDPQHPTDVARAWEWLVNPGVDIPDEGTAVHGVSTERAAADGIDPNAAKTECVNGHPYSPDNTFVSRDGRRYCRICMRSSNRRSRERARQLALVGCAA